MGEKQLVWKAVIFKLLWKIVRNRQLWFFKRYFMRHWDFNNQQNLFIFYVSCCETLKSNFDIPNGRVFTSFARYCYWQEKWNHYVDFFLINKSRKNILAIASLSTLTVSILTIMKKLNFIKKLIGPRILLIAIFGLLLLGWVIAQSELVLSL